MQNRQDDDPFGPTEYGLIMQTTGPSEARKAYEKNRTGHSKEQEVFGITAMAALEELLHKRSTGILMWLCEDESLVTYSIESAGKITSGSNLSMTIMSAAGRMIYHTCTKCHREVPITAMANRGLTLETISNICHACNRRKATTACAASRQERKRLQTGT